ncbi:MAG: hypothetical protein V2L15_01085 [Desulfobacteraceae bacterium]|jgi:hypothetical protein|nr:hypothetical protein [Desulfobacteraceae bacterium]
MGFKENLKRKIDIDRLAARVVESVSGGADSSRRIDKPAMRQLLEATGWRLHPERDLELYLPPEGEADLVLVLDNDLPLYRTTVDDVALRKSPTVKEMVSIRNIRRILNDGDVVVSKKAATVDRFRSGAVARLDLNYTAEDVSAIAFDGAASLESRYPEGVSEALELLTEMLAWQPPPAVFASPHHQVYGRLERRDGGVYYGPLAVFSRVHNRLWFVDRPLNAADEADTTYFGQVLQAKARVAAEDLEAFKALAAAVPAPGRLEP